MYQAALPDRNLIKIVIFLAISESAQDGHAIIFLEKERNLTSTPEKGGHGERFGKIGGSIIYGGPGRQI